MIMSIMIWFGFIEFQTVSVLISMCFFFFYGTSTTKNKNDAVNPQKNYAVLVSVSVQNVSQFFFLEGGGCE